MGNAIIDPMWFYWIQVVYAIKTLLMIISIIGMGITIGAAIIKVIDDEWEKGSIKYIYAAVFFFILLIVALLIPEKQTLIQMKIAEYATYENVDFVIEKITDAAEKE